MAGESLSCPQHILICICTCTFVVGFIGLSNFYSSVCCDQNEMNIFLYVPFAFSVCYARNQTRHPKGILASVLIIFDFDSIYKNSKNKKQKHTKSCQKKLMTTVDLMDNNVNFMNNRSIELY